MNELIINANRHELWNRFLIARIQYENELKFISAYNNSIKIIISTIVCNSTPKNPDKLYKHKTKKRLWVSYNINSLNKY